MPGKVGRPSRADLAARAAAQAAQEAAKIASELPMETENTPEPVSEDNFPPESERAEPQRVAPRNENRRKAFEEVRDRDILSKKGLGVELGLTDEETPKKQEETPTPADLPPPTAESMLQGGKFSPPTVPTVRVKVDGQEFDVSQSEVEEAGGIKAFQIQIAAENRLRKANEALAEVRKIQQEQKPAQQSPDDLIKAKIEVLRWGTQDEAAAALKEILTAQQKPQRSDEEIVQAAADRIAHNEAVKQFDREFTDIGTSRDYLELVMFKRNQRLEKNGHPGDWATFYRSIGNEVRAIMPKQSQPGKVEVTSEKPVTDKEARKASVTSIVSPPQAAARAAVAEEPQPLTREQILNQMKKRRGFPIG